jgi:outer membrane beta-barrel protein
MESRIRLFLLSACALLACAGCAGHRARQARNAAHVPAAASAPQPGSDEDAAADNTPPPVVVQPQVQRRSVRVPHIGARNVELGAYYGILSIENFGSQPVQGVKLDYHVTEDFFFQGAYGQSRAGQTSYELLSGGIQLLSSAERRFTYYDLSLGYNLLPGEIFIGHRLAMTSALYMLGGIGSVDFAGDQNFAVNFGAGFRVLPTDWLAFYVDMQDIVFRTNIFSVYKLSNNLQATVGLSVFF